MSLRCSISKLPISYETPIVAMLLTGAARSDLGVNVYEPESHYVPRTVPIRGVYDDNGRFNYADSRLTELWEEGFAVDAVTGPRGERSPGISRRPKLDDVLEAINNAHTKSSLRVRSLDPPATTIPADVPTCRRVAKVLAASAIHGRAYPDRFPSVYVDCASHDSYEERAAWLQAVELAMEAAGWRTSLVRAAGNADYDFGRDDRVLVTAPDVGMALVERRARMDAVIPLRRVHSYPVTIAIVRADVWDSMLAHPRSRGDDRLDAAYFRVELTRAAKDSSAFMVEKLRELDKQTRVNAQSITSWCHHHHFYDGQYPRVLGLNWAFARAIQHRALGRWTDADVALVIDALAEERAVREVCVSIGHVWAPPNFGCGDDAAEEMNVTMNREWVRLARDEQKAAAKWRRDNA